MSKHIYEGNLLSSSPRRHGTIHTQDYGYKWWMSLIFPGLFLLEVLLLAMFLYCMSILFGGVR